MLQSPQVKEGHYRGHRAKCGNVVTDRKIRSERIQSAYISERVSFGVYFEFTWKQQRTVRYWCCWTYHARAGLKFHAQYYVELLLDS